MADDAKAFALPLGERIRCYLVGPTRQSINDTVYAIHVVITHDDATRRPAAHALRAMQASKMVVAFEALNGNQSVTAVRTDNGVEFQGEFAAKLRSQKIRHEHSLPPRPHTNSQAERFAEGMACLFVALCLLGVLSHGFLFRLRARLGTWDMPFPYELRFNRSFDLSKLRPFGSAC